MAKICYFYILNYRSVKNVGISLDSRYLYTVDDKQKTISLKANPNYIEGFWPKGIASMSAIVGNNGAGKTTSLLYMLHLLAKGSRENVPQAIIVYKNSSGLHVYIPEGCGYKVDEDNSKKCEETSIRPNMEMFYYSAYFRPCLSVHEPGEGELEGVYNASDTWRLVKDYQDYANVDAVYKTEGINFHFEALRAQDNNRIVQLLCDTKLKKMLLKTALPRYIIIGPNKSGYQRLSFELKRKNKNSALYVPQFDSTKEGFFANMVVYDLYNICMECQMSEEDILKSVKRWEKVYREQENVISALAQYLKDFNPSYAHLREMQKVVGFLYDVCFYHENTETLFIDANNPKKQEHIQRLKQYFSDKSFVVAHFFDLGYSHVPTATTRLSSGEFDLLKFFSRLYDATCILPEKFDNLNSPQLILIDEAENSYHPEWQRKFISLLMKFLQALHPQKKGGEEFQIVLTTHSPILLSDIPRDCINYLEKDAKTGAVTISKNQPETFGTNVFDLYRHAFFMSDGLVGEYASEKIVQLQEDIELKKKTYKELLREIEMVGDKQIRMYLNAMLEKDNRMVMIAYYENKLRELKGVR